MAKKLDLFKNFFHSEKAGGFILLGCTAVSVSIANTSVGEAYSHFWHSYLDLSFWKIDLNFSIEHWINDGLMTVFFLLVGLEIERELYIGELSEGRKAILPICAAVGGMLFPALIYLAINAGDPSAIGFGVPMATDIAFALGILSLAGSKVPSPLKIFLTALAIIDDLGAITVIAIFYSKSFQLYYLLAALIIFGGLFIAGKRKILSLPIYVVGGLVMWYCMIKSGVHASVSGVLLAFAIPFRTKDDESPSFRLQHFLHYPVAFLILPVFALANTAIRFPADLSDSLLTPNVLGIAMGLVIGKFIGIFVVSFLAVKTRVATLSADLRWTHIAGVALLGGIGFTMSIFITNLAFTDTTIITASKIGILIASFFSAIIGLIVLKKAK